MNTFSCLQFSQHQGLFNESVLCISWPKYWSFSFGDGDNRGWNGWMASLTCEHEFEQAPGVGNIQENLACCSPWGCKELDTTERLNWTDVATIHFALYKIFCNSFLSLIMICTLYLNLNLFLYYFSIVFVLARCHYLHNFTVLPL